MQIGDKVARKANYPLSGKGIDFLSRISAGRDYIKSYSPQRRDELPIPWPSLAASVGAAQEPEYAPYQFAVNAGVLVGQEAIAANPMHKEVAAYLVERAESTFEYLPSGAIHSLNRYGYAVLGHKWPNPFPSAFSNAYAAVGFVHLYDLTSDESYLATAKKLMDGIVDASVRTPVMFVDEKGYLWFEELIARDSDGNIQRAAIYNGHIIVVLSMMFWRERFQDHAYDDYIEAGITTMEYYLPLQRDLEGSYDRPFRYTAGRDQERDYGPARAVLFAQTLCQVTDDPGICGEAEAFRRAYPDP